MFDILVAYRQIIESNDEKEMAKIFKDLYEKRNKDEEDKMLTALYEKCKKILGE